MITCEEALKVVRSKLSEVKTEIVNLVDSLGRVLAENIVADMEMPPFDKSAMDGYACRYTDLHNDLTLIETIAAGNLPTQTVGPNQCSKIMTGAKVPAGADCVFMVEHSELKSDDIVIFTKDDTKSNICKQGEDIQEGDILINSGAYIKAAHIATMAAVGYAQVTVAVRPSVGVLVTGSELVGAGEKPVDAQIRDSNGPQLCAQVTEAGGLVTFYGIIPDERQATKDAIAQALAENDLLLVSGGSSMGDWDFVPELLVECGLENQFEKIAIKPGKPTVFATSDTAACFGMPGNPVSTFVVFENFVKAWITGSMGLVDSTLSLSLPLAKNIKCKDASRKSFIPVAIDEDGLVAPVKFHGSAHINALTHADALASFPDGVTNLKSGDLIDARFI